MITSPSPDPCLSFCRRVSGYARDILREIYAITPGVSCMITSPSPDPCLPFWRRVNSCAKDIWREIHAVASSQGYARDIWRGKSVNSSRNTMLPACCARDIWRELNANSSTPITLAAMQETSDVRINCSEKCQYARFVVKMHLSPLLGVLLPYACAFLLSCVLLYTDAWIVVLPAMQKTITCSFVSFYLPWFLSFLALKSLVLPSWKRHVIFWADSFALCSQSGFGFDLKMKLWVKISSGSLFFRTFEHLVRSRRLWPF